MLALLMYAAIGTCPDIMYAIHFLSQHSIALGSEHLNAIECTYCYLIGTPDLGLTFYGNQLKCGLTSFSNSDWAGDLNTWRSVSGYTFLFCGAVITWSAKQHQT